VLLNRVENGSNNGGKPLFWGAMGVREGEKNAGLAISECRV
jgi:hypothetical protein